MRLVGQAGGRCDFGSRHAAGEKLFGAPQAYRHQHLVRRDVEVGLKLALEVPRAQRRDVRQLIERDRMHVVVVQIVADVGEAVNSFGQHRRVTGQRLKSID